MWGMADGNRVFTEPEWAFFRVGLETLWAFIEDDDEENTGLSQTGVVVFDVLTKEQKIALLADVGLALRDPGIAMPQHTAANEGAIAAVFSTLLVGLEMEITAAEGTELRRLLHAAVADSDDRPPRLPKPTHEKMETWLELLPYVEDRILWDCDFEMGGEFLDLPPEEARMKMTQMGIDAEYHLAVPRDPNEAELIAARQVLARLLNGPVVDDDGL